MALDSLNSPSAINSASAASEQASTALLTDLACFNKAVGDELRLQILRVLLRDSYGVSELASIFATGQSGMSHHLKVLAEAGLVARRREGNSIFYGRAQQAISALVDGLQQQLLELIDQLPLADEVAERLSDVQALRETHSRNFFEQHAGEFRAQQEQIAEFEVYAEPEAELLRELPTDLRQSVLEIGPGYGHLLPTLAEQFDSVIALDNSQEMLDTAKLHCASSTKSTNISFQLGDTQEALRNGLSAQTIIINMVLHHVASPADMIQDISQMLEPNGRLLIAELCDHNQDWVRDACGDVWLGIDPQFLSSWTERHALTELGSGQYLSLRNGFRVQIRQFLKSPSVTESSH